MQRLFSGFPAGRPGLGLLLLRAATGAAVGFQGAAWLAAPAAEPARWLAGLLAAALGACLVAGLLTPITGAAGALSALAVALGWLPPPVAGSAGPAPANLFVVVMATTVALLGPGAWSVDARLFGRREVVIPAAGDRDLRSG